MVRKLRLKYFMIRKWSSKIIDFSMLYLCDVLCSFLILTEYVLWEYTMYSASNLTMVLKVDLWIGCVNNNSHNFQKCSVKIIYAIMDWVSGISKIMHCGIRINMPYCDEKWTWRVSETYLPIMWTAQLVTMIAPNMAPHSWFSNGSMNLNNPIFSGSECL